MRLAPVCVLALVLALPASAAGVSPLFARGYTVVPQPQQAVLNGTDFPFGPDWRVDSPAGVAVESLEEGLSERFGWKPGKDAHRIIRLVIQEGSVPAAQPSQAYQIDLTPDRITITANAGAGLFYGVETLVQLVARRGGTLWLPAGRITDWPDLPLRQIYWDDAHHLERPGELRRAIRQAAFYKINGFVLKLEGHFQFQSAPAVVEPYAISPADYQELTNYALRYHVQLIPYLDAPAHIAFILKHPEYARLRSYPESNYELCVVNPDSYKLILGMFHDLMDANKGVDYIYLSTDEPYYVGLADNPQCREKEAAERKGSVGELLAEFITKVADDLHKSGRQVIFWGEYPLKPGDIPSLPSHLINGETYGPDFDPLLKAHGIRQMIYTSVEGEEPLFPQSSRPTENFNKISFDPARKQTDVIGMMVAGWADRGLHPETFWLGYVSATAAAWLPASPQPEETMRSFHSLFYGPGVVNMNRVYQLMSRQAKTWTDTWETAPSKARKPIFGYSYGVFSTPRPAKDQTLTLPPVPGDDLAFQSPWPKGKAAAEALEENDELLGLLYENLQKASFNRYNLEVFLSIAQLCRQNLEMLSGIGRMVQGLESASQKSEPKQKLEAIDRALDTAEEIRKSRDQVLADAVATWYKSWLPRVSEANGRKFLHEVDDVKDHWPDRTVDMSYLVYRELLLPFGEWVSGIRDVRNRYAERNSLPKRMN